MVEGVNEAARANWTNSVQKLIDLDESDDWEIFKRKGDWVGMRMKTDVLFALKGECIINSDPQPIIDLIRVPENKLKFSPDIEAAELLHDVDGNLKIIYNRIKTPPIISNRDAVFVQGMQQDGEDTYIASTSTVFPERPEIDGVVRVNVIIGGYIVRPIEPGKCTFSYIMNVDPRGDIPSAVTNMVQKRQIKIVLTIRDIVCGK